MPDTQITDEMVRVAMLAENAECEAEDIGPSPRSMRAALEAALSGHVVVPKADYLRLLQLVELDDMLVICETCGAWLDRGDPATATTDDYNGCWKVAAGEDSDRCKSYRAMIQAAPPVPEMEGG